MPPPPLAPRLLLASASPRRLALLTGADYRVELVPSMVQESAASHLAAAELVRLNARLKASSAARLLLPVRRSAPALVLAADTLVSLGAEVLGKPTDLEHAFAMVSRLAGREHEVYTGVCLLPVGRGWPTSRRPPAALFVERTTVTFRPLTPLAVGAYLARINPLDKAGSYAAQEHGGDIIAQTDGSWSNVLGLPMETLRTRLAGYGISAGTSA